MLNRVFSEVMTPSHVRGASRQTVVEDPSLSVSFSLSSSRWQGESVHDKERNESNEVSMRVVSRSSLLSYQSRAETGRHHRRLGGRN